MVLELHIWGPAFNLPSIDPQCLAAVAYLAQAVPRDQWVLVASNDPAQAHTKELPCLRNGPHAVSGFANIIDSLRDVSDGRWDLDKSLEPGQNADSVAFSSFVQTHLQHLLDLYLFVSTQNYTGVTRPCFSRMLQWPEQYIVPPKHRAAAKSRTEHLGLSSLHIDSVSRDREDVVNRTPGLDMIPQSLRKAPQSVTSLVKQPQHAVSFRLDALTENVLEPLQDLLGPRPFFFSEDCMSSLDCLALGYLSLMLAPQMPHAWLADSMKSKYKNLCVFVREGLSRCFNDEGTSTTIADQPTSMLPSFEKAFGANLPWQALPPKSWNSTSRFLLSNIIDSLPFVGYFRQKPFSTTPNPPTQPNAKSPSTSLPPYLLAATATAITISSYLLFSTGALTLPFASPPRPQRKSFPNYQDLDAILAMPPPLPVNELDASTGNDTLGTNAGSDSIPVAEVEVEVEGDGRL